MQFSHTLTGPKRRGGKDLRLLKNEKKRKKVHHTAKYTRVKRGETGRMKRTRKQQHKTHTKP